MAQGQCYDPFVCLIITPTSRRLRAWAPALNLAPFFDCAFALPEAEQKHFWVGVVSNVPPYPPSSWLMERPSTPRHSTHYARLAGSRKGNRALLSNVPLIGAGNDATAASTPPNTCPPPAFGDSSCESKRGLYPRPFSNSALTGSGYTVLVVDGCVDGLTC